ncbi:MAG: iron ABC transporter substrate-binding protein [Thermoleophilia bacterium]|nr:iron ABC transporter substrate-binding protein [Thermoleophilia bacterium]
MHWKHDRDSQQAPGDPTSPITPLRRLPTGARLPLALLLALLVSLIAAGCGETATTTSTAAPAEATTSAGEPADAADVGGRLVVYSGRSEELIGALVAQFEEQTGVEVEVRYGDTAELAGTILEEGSNSPADVYFAQDGGALGALAQAGRLQTLDADILERVDPRFRSAEGAWVGLSGRARVVVYNTGKLTETDLPASILDFAGPEWKGRLGWAPTNGSFQAFVTALVTTAGEDATRDWLEGVKANGPKIYESNSAIVEAVGNGEIDAGFVNHYYLFRFLKERGDAFPARNYFFPGPDIGNMVNVAGAGILDSAANVAAGRAFLLFMLSEQAQTYFAEEVKEYPLVAGVQADARLKPLADIQTPALDLSDIDDLEGTLRILQEQGIL